MSERGAYYPLFSCGCLVCLTFRRVGVVLARGHGAYGLHTIALSRLRLVGVELLDFLETHLKNWTPLAEGDPGFLVHPSELEAAAAKKEEKEEGKKEAEGGESQGSKDTSGQKEASQGPKPAHRLAAPIYPLPGHPEINSSESKEESKRSVKEEGEKKEEAEGEKALPKAKEEETKESRASTDKSWVPREPKERKEKSTQAEGSSGSRVPRSPSRSPPRNKRAPSSAPSATHRQKKETEEVPCKPPGEWKINLQPRPPQHPPPHWGRHTWWDDSAVPVRSRPSHGREGEVNKGKEKKRRAKSIQIHGPDPERKKRREERRDGRHRWC